MAFVSLSLVFVLSFVILCVGCVAAVAAYIHLKRRKYSHIPSPKLDNFILGHLPTMIKYINKDKAFLEAFVKWYEECGLVFVYYVFASPTVVSLNPEDLKALCGSKTMRKTARFYEILSTVYGERYDQSGLFFILDEDHWWNRRKHFDPLFKKSILNGLLPTANASADHLVERLSNSAKEGSVVSMKDEFFTFMSSISTTEIFGRDLSTRTWTTKELGMKYCKREQWRMKDLMDKIDEGQARAFNPLYEYLHPFKIRGYREVAKAMRKIAFQCIQERLQALENREKFHDDILTYILNLAGNDPDISTEELIDHLITFNVAGTDTTAIMLSFAFIFLSNNPSIKAKLVEEIDTVMGDRTEVTGDDLPRLQYMDQVFKETLRYYPPASGLSRICTEDFDVSGYKVFAGTEMMFSTLTTSHMDKYFKNPDKFDPDRFSPSQIEKPNFFTYYPFGFGARFCLGKNLSNMHAKVVLAKVLKTFSFKPISDDGKFLEEYFITLLMRPLDNIECFVSYRT